MASRLLMSNADEDTEPSRGYFLLEDAPRSVVSRHGYAVLILFCGHFCGGDARKLKCCLCDPYGDKCGICAHT